MQMCRSQRLFLLVEFRIWDFFVCAIGNPGLWNVESSAQESGNPLPIGIRNPSSTDKESKCSTLNPESTVSNPESKTVLDSLSSAKTFYSLSPPASSSISDLTNAHEMGTLVWIRAWWLWNGIKSSFQELRIRIFLHWLFRCRCPFVQFSYVMPDVDEPW